MHKFTKISVAVVLMLTMGTSATTMPALFTTPVIAHAQQNSGWTRQCPYALKGTWKGYQGKKDIEYVMSSKQVNSRYMKKGTAWSGGFWRPEFKYLGHHTYAVRSGYTMHQWAIKFTIHVNGYHGLIHQQGNRTDIVNRVSHQILDSEAGTSNQ